MANTVSLSRISRSNELNKKMADLKWIIQNENSVLNDFFKVRGWDGPRPEYPEDVVIEHPIGSSVYDIEYVVVVVSKTNQVRVSVCARQKDEDWEVLEAQGSSSQWHYRHIDFVHANLDAIGEAARLFAKKADVETKYNEAMKALDS